MVHRGAVGLIDLQSAATGGAAMAITSATLRVLKATDPLGDVRAALRSDGVVIVEGLLGPAARQAVTDEVAPPVAAADPAMRHLNAAIQGFYGTKTRHV